MKATELRIGNLIKYCGEVTDADIMTIHAYDLTTKPTKLYEPIPIDIEWLNRLGFKIVADHTDLWELNNVFVWWYGEDGRKDVMLHKCLPNKFKYQYVHQLQNLYFALTGEELTLTNK